MPAIPYLPPDPQSLSANTPDASNIGKNAGLAGDSPFGNLLSNAVKTPFTSSPPNGPPPPEDSPPPRDGAPAGHTRSTPANDDRSARPETDPQADPSAGGSATNDPQSLLASSVAAANAAPPDKTNSSPPVRTAESDGTDSPPPAPVPGAAPAELVRTILQNTAQAVEAATSALSQTAPPDADGSNGGQSPGANPPPALISALSLTALLPASSANQAADLKPSAPSGATSVPGQPITSGADTATALNQTLPAATSTDVSAVTTAVAVISALDPQPLVKPASGSVDSGNEIRNPAVPAPNVSVTTQVAPVHPIAGDGTQNSQTPPQTGSGSGGDQPARPIDSTLAARVAAANQPAPPASSPALTPAGLPSSGPPVPILATSIDPTGSGANAADKGIPGEPANAGGSDPGSLPSGTQTPGNPLLGAAPSALQLHATNSLATPPTGGSATNVAQVIEQAAYAIQITRANGQEMQLLLNPPDLGALQVSVTVHDGVLSARLEARNPTTQQLLSDNLSQLKNALTEQGVSFDRIDVQLAGSNSGSGWSGTADPSFGRQQEGHSPWDLAPLLATTETDDPVRNISAARGPVSRVPLTSLDIMV